MVGEKSISLVWPLLTLWGVMIALALFTTFTNNSHISENTRLIRANTELIIENQQLIVENQRLIAELAELKDNE